MSVRNRSVVENNAADEVFGHVSADEVSAAF